MNDSAFDQTLADSITELLYSYEQHGMREQSEALLSYIESHLDDESIAQVISSALEYQRVFVGQ